MNNDALIILLNMSGWLIVGYLIRDYFQETKKIKQQLYTTIEKYNELKAMQQVQQQRIEYIEHTMEEIVHGIHHIKEMMDDNNKNLIQELKSELRTLKK